MQTSAATTATKVQRFPERLDGPNPVQVQRRPHLWSRTLVRLPEKVAAAVVEFSYGGLMENSRRAGKPLRFGLDGLHSARLGDFRIAYRIGDRVAIVAIEHRTDVYRPTE